MCLKSENPVDSYHALHILCVRGPCFSVMSIQHDHPITFLCHVLLVMQAGSIEMEIKFLMENSPLENHFCPS